MKTTILLLVMFLMQFSFAQGTDDSLNTLTKEQLEELQKFKESVQRLKKAHVKRKTQVVSKTGAGIIESKPERIIEAKSEGPVIATSEGVVFKKPASWNSSNSHANRKAKKQQLQERMNEVRAISDAHDRAIQRRCNFINSLNGRPPGL